MADLLKHAPSHICYHGEFGCSELKGVGISTGEPPNRGALEHRSLEMGGVANPKIHVPPMCYHVEFGISARKGAGHWGGLGLHPFSGGGVTDHVKQVLFP